MRNAVLVLSSIAIGAVIAVAATRYSGADGPKTADKLVASHDLLSQSFRVWEVDDLPRDRGDTVRVVVRAKHTVDGNPAIDSRPISVDEANAEVVMGGAVQLSNMHELVRVVVQSLDLRKIAGAQANAEAPLRLVVQLSDGGATVFPNAERTIIAGTEYIGEAITEPKWDASELHLCNVFTKSDSQSNKYSVVLQVGDWHKAIDSGATSR